MKQYSLLDIYFFSGTGNARYAANTIAKNARRNGCRANVYDITGENNEISSSNKDQLIGFCFPTHGFNAPPVVLKFIYNFPRGKSDVFLLNTRAGMKLYKFYMPGIGGLALWLTALILIFKGYRPIGFRPLDMPSNWISLHPGIRAKVVESITENCTKTLEKFTNRILKGKPVLNGFIWLPIDILLIPITVGYYFFGRFAIAKTFFANYKCNNCGLCIRQCPVKAIIEKKIAHTGLSVAKAV